MSAPRDKGASRFNFQVREVRLITDEDMTQMLAELEKREAANRKRSETMKTNAARRKAERLSRPPADLEEAWRRHAETCPHLAFTEEASAWFRSHPSFEFDGTRWRRDRTFQRANSGNSRHVRSIAYYGEDGRVVTTFDAGPNRRNDETRNWGLGRG